MQSCWHKTASNGKTWFIWSAEPPPPCRSKDRIGNNIVSIDRGYILMYLYEMFSLMCLRRHFLHSCRALKCTVNIVFFYFKGVKMWSVDIVISHHVHRLNRVFMSHNFTATVTARFSRGRSLSHTCPLTPCTRCPGTLLGSKWSFTDSVEVNKGRAGRWVAMPTRHRALRWIGRGMLCCDWSLCHWL